jgi:hypothetical protein
VRRVASSHRCAGSSCSVPHSPPFCTSELLLMSAAPSSCAPQGAIATATPRSCIARQAQMSDAPVVMLHSRGGAQGEQWVDGQTTEQRL